MPAYLYHFLVEIRVYTLYASKFVCALLYLSTLFFRSGIHLILLQISSSECSLELDENLDSDIDHIDQQIAVTKAEKRKLDFKERKKINDIRHATELQRIIFDEKSKN